MIYLLFLVLDHGHAQACALSCTVGWGKWNPFQETNPELNSWRSPLHSWAVHTDSVGAARLLALGSRSFRLARMPRADLEARYGRSSGTRSEGSHQNKRTVEVRVSLFWERHEAMKYPIFFSSGELPLPCHAGPALPDRLTLMQTLVAKPSHLTACYIHQTSAHIHIPLCHIPYRKVRKAVNSCIRTDTNRTESTHRRQRRETARSFRARKSCWFRQEECQ